MDFGHLFEQKKRQKTLQPSTAPAPSHAPVPTPAPVAKPRRGPADTSAAPADSPGVASRELNALLARLARGKQLSACRAAFKVGVKAGTVDAWSYAILINAHATCGDGVGALRTLSRMRAAGHRPCVMSYTAALKAPCGRGDLGEASRLLAELETDFAEHARATGRDSGGGEEEEEDADDFRGKRQRKKKAKAARKAGAAAADSDWTPNVSTACRPHDLLHLLP